MKYGISENFADMTLIPDFGQTSDDYVLNTSPYEIRYNENRPLLKGLNYLTKQVYFTQGE